MQQGNAAGAALPQTDSEAYGTYLIDSLRDALKILGDSVRSQLFSFKIY